MTKHVNDHIKFVFIDGLKYGVSEPVELEIIKLRKEVTQLTAANKDSYTTIEEESHTAENTEYGLVVCQKCKTALPVAMIKYQFKYCPMCGREITDKPTPPTGGENGN